MRRWLQITVNAAQAWNADNAFKHSAAVSFYTLFSLAPITLIAVGVTGFFFGRDVAAQQFSSQVTQLVGKESAALIEKAMEANALERQSGLKTAIGAFLLMVGATTVFGQLQGSLNEIWGVTATPRKSGWVLMIIQRLISFAMVLTVAFLLAASLILTTALTTVVGLAEAWISNAPWLLRAADLGAGLIIITVLFALLFKVLPDVRIQWREAWLGAFVTALLFSIGRYLIALYLGHTTIAKNYGAAGSLVALLIWIYYSCAILFYGVEFVKAHRLSGGLKVEPKETAVVVHKKIARAPSRKP